MPRVLSQMRIIPALVALLWLASPALAATASVDDTARILAGLEPSAGSPLAGIAQSEGWKRHARHFDRAWGTLEQRQLSKIRSWTAANIRSESPTMFYMFSGPDYLYADTFFPGASTYVLSGLEPVGKVPDLTEIPKGSLERDLRELQVSLYSVMNLSFFITKKMKSELASGRLTGTLPLLYVFLARAGKTISDVTFISLDAEGKVQEDDGKPGPAKGVRIGFKAADGRAQTLYYFSTNIADDGFEASGFQKFCAGLGPGSSFVKSASYLMHLDYFSKVRGFLLENSQVLLQDDSGIPVRFFEARSWKLTPHGRYLGPIGTFPGKYQPALARLFSAGSQNPIDFGVGYRWRPRESNLMLAEKGVYPAIDEAPLAAEPAPRKKVRAPITKPYTAWRKPTARPRTSPAGKTYAKSYPKSYGKSSPKAYPGKKYVKKTSKQWWEQ